MGLPELCLKQDCPTRWNSTFYMLKRFYEMKEAVITTLALVNPGLLTLSPEEWEEIKEACDVLKPFEEVTVEVSCESQEPVLLNGLTDLLKKKIPEVFDELQTNGILTEKTSLKLVKVCISDLVERHGLYLATGDSYRTIAFSYRVGHATVAVIVREVAGAIWTALVEETMPVPQTEDWRAIAAEFQERWNFPNCVGAIDGKHVVIQAPANSGSLYFNYKSTHSLVLLAVVDAQYLFRVVDVGGFGRSSDSGSLRNSAFGESLRDGSLHLPPDTVIPGAERLGLLPHVLVGDEAFPLLDNLLRPFPGRHLTREKRMFNYRLSRARLVVECAFGILSSQWRMFRRVITTSPENETAGGGAEDVGHQAGLGAERPNRNPSQNGSAAGDAAVAIGEHQTVQGQGAERSNPNPSQ
ncbi:hypothetical protein JOQ06_028970, partial [Pogonophryne albipinna]